jgi:hypothetical protein
MEYFRNVVIVSLPRIARLSCRSKTKWQNEK